MAKNKKNSANDRQPGSGAQKVWSITKGVGKTASVVLQIVFGALVTVLLICGVCAFVFMGALGDYLQDDILPSADMTLDSIDLDENSNLYYVDNGGNIQLLQQVFATTNSQWAEYEDIPQDLIHAAVAIEDKRFFEHQGVDWFTTIKACARMFFGDSSVGGSSITQQTIKNLLLSQDEHADDVTVQRKVIEIFRATQLEKRYDKEQIMEYYLNVIYLGNRCRGVRSAAATYFGKELETLTTAECASLISITNNPSIYNPYRGAFTEGGSTGAEKNRERQLTVLSEMKKQGWLTEEAYNEAVAQEMVFKKGIALEDTLTVCSNPECANKTTVGNLVNTDGKYYCPECGRELAVSQNASKSVYSWFVDTALEDVAMKLAEKDGMEWNSKVRDMYMSQISRAGYRIYTTLDMQVQNQVDKIYNDLSQIPATRSGQQLQSAIVVVDNRTGDIVAMSGGVGEKVDFDAFNRATDARVQSGSSIKPLTVYAPAFEAGKISPATVISDMPFTYTNGAWPNNDNRVYGYSRTVFRGIVSSINAVATHTLDKIGTRYSFEFARDKFRLSTLLEEYVDRSGKIQSDVDYAPLALGAQVKGVTVRDMTCAFASFANNGTYRVGRTFTKVYDSEGNLVLDNTQDSEEILSAKTVNYVNYCLTNAVQAGTGGEARLGTTAVAGKTGTSSKSKDRWFCGFTSYYTAAVWTGYDTPETIYNYGGNPAAQLWRKVMEPLHTNKSWVNLYSTANMRYVEVCLDSGMLATDACKADGRGISRVDTVMVYPEDAPTRSCTKHVEVEYCTQGHGVANEFCKKLAESGSGVKLETRVLVKLTQKEVDAIQKASRYGLSSEFANDNYVYLVDNNGDDANFKGFNGNANAGESAPYIICTTHTKESLESIETEPQETEDDLGSE